MYAYNLLSYQQWGRRRLVSRFATRGNRDRSPVRRSERFSNELSRVSMQAQKFYDGLGTAKCISRLKKWLGHNELRYE